jgi:hypothetical protein
VCVCSACVFKLSTVYFGMTMKGIALQQCVSKRVLAAILLCGLVKGMLRIPLSWIDLHLSEQPITETF